MGRISFLYRTDVHVADKSPVSWKGDYPTEIWENLRQIGVLANEKDVRAVLDGGDFFHVKSATRNSHDLVRRAAELHKAHYTVPTFSVEGNHDITYNDLESIHKQPLGVLYASGVFGHLRDEVFEDAGIRVRVVGVPYSPFRTADELRAIQKQPGDDFLVAIVHSLAGANPPASVEEFFGEPVFRYAELATPDGPDVWAFGHWHKDQGVVEYRGKHFVNLGAVSRGSLSKDNLERSPKVALIDFTPGRILVEPIELKVAPASEVFHIERKERLDREAKEIDQFVDRLNADATLDPSASIEDNLKSLSFAADVRDLALLYLERARAEVG
jgi:DNA repair exonuclease SbcCD nuclease subunit